MLIPALIALGCLGAVLLLPLFLFVWVALHRSRSTTGPQSLKRSAAVVVLGDVGRSPRMCYHAESLANEGWKVGLVGYAGTTLPPPLQRPSVKLHALVEPPRSFAKLPKAAFLVVAPLKIAIQSTSLFWALAVKVHPPPELIVVQTPPALPTLFIVRLVAALLNARVIIDWHNLGYTILGLRLGASHPLVKLAAWLERVTGRRAFAHLFVTHAMRRHLNAQWKLRGHKAVLHDRPPVHFRRAQPSETHALFTSLGPRLKPALNDFLPAYKAPDTTLFTKKPESSQTAEPVLRPDRPALAVSSTSWTADEDFDILLEAARKYEFRAQRLAAQTQSASPSSGTSGPSLGLEDPNRPGSSSSSNSHGNQAQPIRRLPKLLIIVTGKGQLRAHYEQLIANAEREERWRYVRIRTVWLEVEEYPILLGSADIGISLHSSSSGLDLPMKVVDMLGCGLPVLALNFPCLPELVSDGRNGLIFNSAGQLAEQLAEVVHNGLCVSLVEDESAAASAAGAGSGRNWMVRAMEEDESLAFGWGDEPPEAIVAAATTRASTDRLVTFKWGGSSPGLPTHASASGTSTPSAARDSLESPTQMSLVGSPTLDAGGSGTHLWKTTATGEPLSPGAAAAARRRSARARKVATWTGNWRRVVRPLLNAAEEDASESTIRGADGRPLLPSDLAMAERRKRKLERAKRKGKGTSVHHRRDVFGQLTPRDDADFLLHNSDDDDDESDELKEDGEGGQDAEDEATQAFATAAAGAGGPSQSHSLLTRKQRGGTDDGSNALSSISIAQSSPPATMAYKGSPSGGASYSSPSSSSGAPYPHVSLDSPSTSFQPHLDRRHAHGHAHAHAHGHASSSSSSSPVNSEPLSPVSQRPTVGTPVGVGLNAPLYIATSESHRRLSSGGAGLASPGTSPSDADKRWRRRRTYSGSSSLYNGLAGGGGAVSAGPASVSGHGDGAPEVEVGLELEVEVGGEFVTPFDDVEDVASPGPGGGGSGVYLASPRGNRPGGSSGRPRPSLSLFHSPLSSPKRRASAVLYESPSPSTSPPGRPLSQQLGSGWSPEQRQQQQPRRPGGGGDVPHIRVSPAG